MQYFNKIYIASAKLIVIKFVNYRLLSKTENTGIAGNIKK